MADDAFALSPIAARAAQPSDEDYGAICEAFMETSRGRWFLTEYARRNRNADTRAVLDAVARIEDTLARQRQNLGASDDPQATVQNDAQAGARDSVQESAPDAAQDVPQDISQDTSQASAAPDPRLHELEQRLASIISAIREALDAAREALPASEPADPAPDPEEALAPIRHAGQMVQGVAWTLRESGADGRICALLDQQAKTIAQATLHPALSRMQSACASQTSAADVFAALHARLHALLEHDGLAFASDFAMEAGPMLPRIIIPNDDFEIVERAGGHVTEHITEHADRPENAGQMEQPPPAPETHDAEARDLDIELFDDPPAAENIKAVDIAPANVAAITPDRIPGAPSGPATLGAAIVDATLQTNATRAHADPLAPFARMTKAERIAFFS